MGSVVSSLFGGAPKTPKPPALPPPAAPAPTLADPSVQRARAEIMRMAALTGRSSQILTSPQGLTSPASTSKKTLLGT